jgi:hypothetical protein
MMMILPTKLLHLTLIMTSGLWMVDGFVVIPSSAAFVVPSLSYKASTTSLKVLPSSSSSSSSSSTSNALKELTEQLSKQAVAAFTMTVLATTALPVSSVFAANTPTTSTTTSNTVNNNGNKKESNKDTKKAPTIPAELQAVQDAKMGLQLAQISLKQAAAKEKEAEKADTIALKAVVQAESQVTSAKKAVLQSNDQLSAFKSNDGKQDPSKLNSLTLQIGTFEDYYFMGCLHNVLYLTLYLDKLLHFEFSSKLLQLKARKHYNDRNYPYSPHARHVLSQPRH